MGFFFPLKIFSNKVENLTKRWFNVLPTEGGCPTTPSQTAGRRSAHPGKLVFQYLKKRPALPKCPMTGVKLKGVKPSRPAERKRLSLRHKKVFRAYGGVLSHKAVREKIVRAFLIEEQKLV